MAKLKINAGTTSKTVRLFIQDSTSTTGAGLAGLTSGSSGLVAYYLREGAAGPATAIGLTAGSVGTWSSGGFVAADASHLPGVYELGVPNTALASGAQSVVMMLFGATNMVPVVLEIELDAVNYQSSTGFVASVPAVVGAVGSVSNPATIAASILLTPAHLLAVDVNNEVTANNVSGGGTVSANIVEINGSTFSGANVPAFVQAFGSVQAPANFLGNETKILAIKAKTDILVTVPYGTVLSSPAPTTTTCTCSGLGSVSYVGQSVYWQPGSANAGATPQTISASSGGALTFGAFASAPLAGDTFIILP